MLSLWYELRDDALWCATAASADLVEFLDHDPSVAFEASVNDPPYRGVRGQGEATVEPDPDKTVLRSLLDRYLGGTDSTLAQQLLDKDRAEVRIRIDPTRVATWDYSERMEPQSSDRDDPA
jgi:recombinational DNA repair protein RecT